MKLSKRHKVIYSILKELTDGDSIPTAKDCDMSDKQFQEVLILMKNEKYLNPKRVQIYIDGKIDIQRSIDTVTMKGLEFLKQNNKCTKIYTWLKEIVSFLRFRQFE